jgi:6-phosphogluconolactonase
MTERMRPVSEPDVIVLPDVEAVAEAAAERIAAGLAGAVERRGRADWVTTGGSTPLTIYPLLARGPLRAGIPWDGVHIWWSDDRFVPRDHPLSNVFPVESILLSFSAHSGESGEGEIGVDVDLGTEPGVHVPAGNVHPFPCTEAIARGAGPDWCAAAYHAEMRQAPLRLVDAWPVFDLILLGLGPDGHLMSVFPNSETFDSTAWADGVPAPTHVEPHVPRVTLNPRVLDVATSVLMVTTGASKASIVGRIFGPARDERSLPGQLVRRAGVTWLLDEAAAADLPEGIRTA